jgi:hypothetical protein
MQYKIEKNKIVIEDLSQFNINHILDCGQIFRYEIKGNQATVCSLDKFAKVVTYVDKVEILTEDVDYFVNFFDLKTDYNAIKQTSSASYVLIDSYANEYSAYLYEVDITTGLAIFTCNWDYYGSVIGLGEYSEVVAKVDNVSWIHKTTIESNIKSSTMTYLDTTYKSYYLNDMNLNGGTIFINDQNKIIGMYSSKLNVIVSEKVLELIINF